VIPAGADRVSAMFEAGALLLERLGRPSRLAQSGAMFVVEYAEVARS